MGWIFPDKHRVEGNVSASFSVDSQTLNAATKITDAAVGGLNDVARLGEAGLSTASRLSSLWQTTLKWSSALGVAKQCVSTGGQVYTAARIAGATDSLGNSMVKVSENAKQATDSLGKAIAPPVEKLSSALVVSSQNMEAASSNLKDVHIQVDHKHEHRLQLGTTGKVAAAAACVVIGATTVGIGMDAVDKKRVRDRLETLFDEDLNILSRLCTKNHRFTLSDAEAGSFKSTAISAIGRMEQRYGSISLYYRKCYDDQFLDHKKV
jgi:hypothetical protein